MKRFYFINQNFVEIETCVKNLHVDMNKRNGIDGCI